ncbi:DinB family protein [Tenggerimyces flavus]|uniref:DinB family protein n=1 Tax=Tenggerimyces flavus TaxID=1708749 RepID=A0ABV7Y3U3_9ACTN|nr:DinB family protein [Tenggerimyces flavus]MBM7790899.1 hypothetical protein [Tenggerimyces flavus]
MTELREDLLGLSDFAWERLRTRVEGLTDEEFSWEPMPGCWSIRDGKADGDALPPDPPPFTTISWRLNHLMDVLQAERTATWFGHQPLPDDGLPTTRTTAAAAIEGLDHAYAVWRRRLAALSQDDLDRPMGELAGRYGKDSGNTFALHILDELIHHGAEVGVVRDLYRGQQSEDPSVTALLNGDRPADLDRVRTERPSLVAEAAAAKRWDAVPPLLALGFAIDARSALGRTAVQLAAGSGELETLKLLVEAGADLTAEDPAFHATPLGWARYFDQPDAAAYLLEKGAR